MKLQFTNGYRPHFDQISRILQFLVARESDKKVPQREIVEALGIPTNQVENLVSMMIGFGLVAPRTNVITGLGKTIIQSDPYFEKSETLWIIHYIVSSEPEWVVWYRVVNKAISSLDKFSVDMASRQFFGDLVGQFSDRTIAEKLPKEVGAVLASYTRTELSKLNLIEMESTGHFVTTTPTDISSLAFLYCILFFKERYLPGASAMTIEDIGLAENGPGRVLNLPEHRIRALLSEAHVEGLIRLEQLANLDQVRIPESLTIEKVLSKIYPGKS